MDEAAVESHAPGGPAKGRRKAQGKPSKRKAEPPGGAREEDYNDPTVRVSPFDYSVENHFTAMETVSKLCREDEELDESEVKLLPYSVTFLRQVTLCVCVCILHS